jgi:adenylylsulfate kinase-like enzyme
MVPNEYNKIRWAKEELLQLKYQEIALDWIKVQNIRKLANKYGYSKTRIWEIITLPEMQKVIRDQIDVLKRTGIINFVTLLSDLKQEAENATRASDRAKFYDIMVRVLERFDGKGNKANDSKPIINITIEELKNESDDQTV